MKHHFINNNSNKLLLFFTGWGCDEFCFEHLKSKSDILLFYDYQTLDFDFDFKNYDEINLIAYSAGVFVASVLDFDFKINKKIAISGNPNLFDEYFGISKDKQDLLYNITLETADDFLKNYLIKTEEEYKNFHPAQRTIESCKMEFNSLKKIYSTHKKFIKNIYDTVYMGEFDTIFNFKAQTEYYKDKVKIIKNARHNPFFKIKNYEDILTL